MADLFRAIRVYEKEDGEFGQEIQQCNLDELPANNTLIRVRYSSLNFKDALSATGHKGVTKQFPHTPGIDAAGEIVETTSTDFKVGEEVIVTGFDLGMNTWGGFSQYIRVPDSWLIHKPERMSMKYAMSLGTAGLTAGLSVSELFLNDVEDRGTIVITGATGGVGIIALTLLSRYDYKRVVVSGNKKKYDLLEKLGADQIIPREKFYNEKNKPLLKGEYSGAIDVAGGKMLSTLLSKMSYGGTVTCCGLVDSPELHTTVFPFILRGIRLIGIDSVESDLHYRKKIWHMFANEWKFDFYPETIHEIGMEQVPEYIPKILNGEITGRTVINID
ncbi:MAG: YhdH/YhfP family quinone oxidoreductase [Bacteroidales bacterium]